MSIATTSQLRSIQALRGLAALGVALLHLAGLQMLEGFRETTGIFAYGWIGVDLFFIISGFIMVWVTRRIQSNPKTAIRFIMSRAARIYPLWWVSVSLVALFFFLVHGAPASVDVIPKTQAWGYYARSLILWPQELAPLLDVGWTLIHEMFFYIVFTFIIAIGLRKKLLWGLLAWGAVTALGIMLNLGSINPVLKIIFNPLSFLFIAGAMIGNFRTTETLNKWAWPLLGLSLLIIFSLILFGVLDKRERVIQLIVPLSLLLWSVVTLENSRKIRTPKPLIWLGDISYALYLTHPLVVLAWRVIRPFYQDGLLSVITSKMPTSWLVYLDMLALMIVFIITAAIFHFFIERTAARLANKVIPSYKIS